MNNAIKAFEAGYSGDVDPDEIWFNVSYNVPTDPILLLPLNVTRNGVLALGRKGDDQRPIELTEDPDNLDELYNFYARSKSYGFEAWATAQESGIELVFRYDSESLDKAVRLAPKQIRTIAWPDEFNLILIGEGFPEDGRYLEKLGGEFTPLISNDTEDSILTIVANGVEEMAQSFRVSNGILSEHQIDYGAYDNSEVEFEYTSFHVTRMPGG